MSDLDQQTAPAEQPNAGTAISGEEQPASQQTTPSVETTARAQGWVPQDEWRGDPAKWRPADEFVRRGEEELPILRERSRDMARKLADLEHKLASADAGYKQNLANLERMTGLALVRQRDSIVSQYEAAMRQAAEVGDVARYDQLRRDMGESVHQFDNGVRAVRQAEQQQPQQQAPPREVQDFTTRNPWFNADAALNMEAQAIHMMLQRDRPELSLGDNLKAVESEIKRRYPQRFGTQQPAQQQPQYAVEGGGGRVPASTGRGKGAADLPADARAQAEKFVRDGLFKDINEYARDYWAQ